MDSLLGMIFDFVMVVLTLPSVATKEWTCSTDVNTTWPSTEALRNFGNTLSGRAGNFMESFN